MDNNFTIFRKLNNYQIRTGVWLSVMKSVDNKKILIKTFPTIRPQLTDGEILQELQRHLKGVLAVSRHDPLWLQVSKSDGRSVLTDILCWLTICVD